MGLDDQDVLERRWTRGNKKFGLLLLLLLHMSISILPPCT